MRKRKVYLVFEFPERFKRSIYRSEMSIRELQALSGIDKPALYRYMNGEIMPGGLALRKLSDALQVSADYLIGREPADYLSKIGKYIKK